jgi:hypothetical protein
MGAVLLMTAAPARLVAADGRDTTGGSLTVTLRYTGQGDVDDTHRLWIWIFDTPDIGPGSMPISEASLAKNGDSTTIEALGPDTVWIAVAYDQRGGSPGNVPPAPGSPVAIYAGADGRPTPVTPGDGARADVTFDDSLRMP